MRSLFHTLAVGALVLFGASAAGAGALNGGSFTLAVGTIPPLTFPGTGLTGSGSDGAFPLAVTLGAGSGFQGTLTTPITGAGPTLTKLSVQVASNAAGNWTGTPPIGGASGTVFGTSITFGLGGNPLLSVPLAAGAGGTVMTGGGGLNLTIFGQPWTTGATTITGLTGTMTTEMATGSVVSGSPGTVTFVAPSKIVVTGAANITTFSVATLALTFDSVPEPTAPLMLLAGGALLAGFGYRKIRD